MTTTMPPSVPGSRRTLPIDPDAGEIDRVRRLMGQREHWVLRGDWARFLAGEEDTTVAVGSLKRDQRIAAAAWIAQQRHVLHATLDEGRTAPEGWVESLPLYQALTSSPD